MTEFERKSTILDINLETEGGLPTNSHIVKTIEGYNTIYKSDNIKVFLIKDFGKRNYLLKKISLTPSASDRIHNLRIMTINKELEILKILRECTNNFVPEIIDSRYYKDNETKDTICIDILFDISGNDCLPLDKNYDMNPIHDLIFFLSKFEELDLPYGALCDYNNFVCIQGMKLVIIGLGLIESVLACGVETNKTINKDNLSKIIEYIKNRNPEPASKLVPSSIQALKKDYVAAFFKEVTQSDAFDKNEEQFKSISNEMFSSSIFCMDSLIKPMNCFKIHKLLFIVLGFLALLIGSVSLIVYYGMSYSEASKSVDDINIVSVKQSTLIAEIKGVLKKYNRNQLFLDAEPNSFVDAFEELQLMVHSMIKCYENKLKLAESQIASFVSKLSTLQDNYSIKVQEYMDLYIKHSNLSEEYRILSEEHNKLSEEHRELSGESNKLSEEHKELTAKYKETLTELKRAKAQIATFGEFSGSLVMNMPISNITSQNITNYKLIQIESAIDFYRDNDGNYFILGSYLYTQGTGIRRLGIVSFSINSEGKAKNYNTYEIDNGLKFYDVIYCKHGGIAYTGFYISNYTIISDKLWIIKTYPNGIKEWLYSNTNIIEGAHALIEDNDGGIIAVGSSAVNTSSTSKSMYAWISKINDGIQVWVMYLGIAYNCWDCSTNAKAIIRNWNSNKYIVVGCDNSILRTIVFNSSGKNYDIHYLDGNNIFIHDLVEIDNGFIAIGSSRTEESDPTATSFTRMYKIDYNGVQVWYRDIRDSRRFFYYQGYTVAYIPNGYVIGGRRCYPTQYSLNYQIMGMNCENWLRFFNLDGSTKWEAQFSTGTIKRIKYEGNGNLSILEDLGGAVGFASYHFFI